MRIQICIQTQFQPNQLGTYRWTVPPSTSMKGRQGSASSHISRHRVSTVRFALCVCCDLGMGHVNHQLMRSLFICHTPCMITNVRTC